MTELDPRAERLQALLARQELGESPGALAAEAADDTELAALLALAGGMARVMPSRAPAPFKARLQADLQNRMPSRGRKPRQSGGWRWLPRFASAALAVALVVATAVVASADSLPGQPLYSVKLAVEDTRLALASSAYSRALVRLDIADARAYEVLRLIDRGIPIDAAIVEALIRSQQAAVAEARAAGDPDLMEEAIEAARRGSAVALTAIGLVPEADRPFAEGTARAWSAAVAPVPAAAGTRDMAVPRPTRHREATRTVVPSALEPSSTAEPPMAARSTSTPTPEPPPFSSASPVPPAAATDRAAPSPESPSDTPTATVAPPTDAPPTPLATLDRATQRAATQSAPTATPRRRWTPATPTPSPTVASSEPVPSQTPREPRRPHGLPPALPDPRSTASASPSPTLATP